MSDSGERTERATEKRLREVYEQGKLQRSQDLTAWVGIGAAALMIPATISAATDAAVAQFAAVADAAADPDPLAAVHALDVGFASVLPSVGWMLAVVAGAVLAAAALQGGVHLRKKFVRFEHLEPVGGLKRIFGMQAVWQGVKALVKSAVVAGVLLLVVQGLMPVLLGAGGLPLNAVLQAAADGTTWLVLAAVAAGLGLAAADVLVVARRNRKHTMMTKRELQDEHKHTDGDPLIKSQRRARQLAMSRNRMIAAIADADVVVVNPTHVAVALRYEPGKSAPRLVAKGKGHVATRIREEAERTGVPMVRDIPLARALHAGCAVGHEIPVDLYQAVAVLLAFVAVLRRRGRAALRGIHSLSTMQPTGGRP
ncbi:EscU/YscU/HrcU family type III secretion system export apparatus switch protein [Agromyces sp. G08B096]|uniref:EscU/YscU/HrcU family type III secretion system export apparatus switch protein n=1 Tax=Agromyces sp. G08B096 TaxID=3156399 RepID=A0AAU7W856_9MICO